MLINFNGYMMKFFTMVAHQVENARCVLFLLFVFYYRYLKTNFETLFFNTNFVHDTDKLYYEKLNKYFRE